MFCIYCGKRQERWCRDCGENHLVTAQEFKDETGDWPEDASEDEISEESDSSK